jgi:uncharacterized protein YdaT
MCFFRKRRERKKALEAERVASTKPVEVAKEEQEAKPKPAPKKSIVKDEPVKTEGKAAKYHVSQNKDPKNDHYKEWRVRKEGSNKTIKYFNTQKEAIEYAEKLAEEAGSSVVIHKLDGSIRKQDYIKK